METQPDPNGESMRSAGCFFPERYKLGAICFMGFAMVMAMRVNFNIALVAMTNFTEPVVNSSSDECSVNMSYVPSSQKQGEFDWSPTTQSILLGAFFYAYPLTQLPGGYLAERYGAKPIIGFALCSQGLITLLIPLLAKLGSSWLIAGRVLMGLFCGPVYASHMALWGKWAPPLERTKLLGLAESGGAIGTVIFLPVSGMLCDSTFLGGWPSVFYLVGVLCLMWVAVWFIFVHDAPSKHPKITPAELRFIENTTHNLDQVEYTNPPWCSILTSIPFWAANVVLITDYLGFYVIFSCASLYLKQVLKFDIAQDGLLMSLPYIASFFVIIFIAPFSDFLVKRGYRRVVVRKMCSFISEFGMAACLVGMGLVGCNRLAAVSFMIVGTAIQGFQLGGFVLSYLDMAPLYSGSLRGIGNGLANVAGFSAPLLVKDVTNNSSSLSEWQLLFFIVAGIQALGGLIYIIFGSSDEQAWAKQGQPVLNVNNIQEERPDVEEEGWQDDGYDTQVLIN